MHNYMYSEANWLTSGLSPVRSTTQPLKYQKENINGREEVNLHVTCTVNLHVIAHALLAHFNTMIYTPDGSRGYLNVE